MTNMEQDYSSTKHTILYEWKINEVTSLIESTETEDCVKLTSPAFSTGAKLQDSWCLELKINERDGSESTKKYLSAYLQPNNGDKQVRIKYSLFIHDKNKKKHFVRRNSQVFDDLDGCGFDLVELENLLSQKEEFLFNDTLTVCIKLTVYDNDDETLTNSSKRKLADDFQQLLESKIGSDVLLNVGDQKIYAHKSILIARSPVFASILINGIDDKKNELTISDFSPEIIEKMLQFIYTDQIIDLDSDAKDLLQIADKYQLQALKELCEESLCKSITIDNAVDIMVLAEKNHAKRLLEFATNYVVINASHLVRNGSFRVEDHLNCSVVSNLFKKIMSTIISDSRANFPFTLKQFFMSCLFFVVFVYYIYVYLLSGVVKIYRATRTFMKNRSLAKNKLLSSSDNITLSGELTVFNDHTSFSANIPFKTSKRLNTDDFKQLFDNNNEISSDVTLEVGGHEFKAHKVMLMVRNPLVSAMFMEKLKENKVDIADIDQETLKKLLEFIFTDKVNALNNYSELLLKDTDKNQLQKLKSICDESLCNSITLKYAMKMMIIDDNSDQLREYATVFIVINITHIMKAINFNSNNVEFPLTLSEIDDKLAIMDKDNDEEEKKSRSAAEIREMIDFD
ncbi:speckle-type POZ protein-like [Cotesia typhae]|uniref:speckle-type POZ protein-like n=1 Tax=Cotesia typhae TaxID=2053667 RepID=UPI003D68742E